MFSLSVNLRIYILCDFRMARGVLFFNLIALVVSSRPPAQANLYVGDEEPDLVWSRPSHHRVAMLLRGETFRFDTRANQSDTFDYNQSRQLNATRSQMEKVVIPFEHYGFEVDVFSATYDTFWHRHLMREWAGRLRADVLLQRPGSQTINMMSLLQRFQDLSSQHHIGYDLVIVLRHDTFIKQDLAHLILSHTHKHDHILFAFKALSHSEHGKALANFTSDLLFVIPGYLIRSFADVVSNSQENRHITIWNKLLPIPLGVLVHGRYWTNDVFGPNPIYEIAGRQAVCGGGMSVHHCGPLGISPVLSSYEALGALVVVTLVALILFLPATDLAKRFLSFTICGIYLFASVTIDLIISSQKTHEGDPTNAYAFDPILAVIFGELLKLLASLILWCARWFYDGGRFVPSNLSFVDAKYLSFPAMAFAANNVLVWWAIGGTSVAEFGIFRDTLILWTALIWLFVFRKPLGLVRLVGIGVTLVGLLGNKVTMLMTRTTWSWNFVWVLAMTLTNAIGSVANEAAMKQNSGLDINVQNAVLYLFGVLAGLTLFAVSESQRIGERPAILSGFTAVTLLTICLQAMTGLMVSRLLKYCDSLMKCAASCMRGPILTIIAYIMSQDSTTRVLHIQGISNIACAVVVGIGCFVCLSQGPLTQK